MCVCACVCPAATTAGVATTTLTTPTTGKSMNDDGSTEARDRILPLLPLRQPGLQIVGYNKI